MRREGPIPTIGEYRGVALHCEQDEERLAVVRSDIDRVFAENDLQRLVEIADDVSWSPESRLLAGAKIEAAFALATERREMRPNVDLAFVQSCTAGLDSNGGRDPIFFCSIWDPRDRGEGYPQPVKRPKPLDD